MSRIFVVLVCLLPIIIAQRNGQPHIITNDGPLRGRMPLPKEPGKLRCSALYQRSCTGRYNMRFNPQTGQMEMVRIGDVPASSTGGTPAVASGPLANAGVAAVLSVICSFEISSPARSRRMSTPQFIRQSTLFPVRQVHQQQTETVPPKANLHCQMCPVLCFRLFRLRLASPKVAIC